MRRELREAVAALFRSIQLEANEFDAAARKRMAALATFVAHARSAVERDRYRREIELIPDSEMPGRLARTGFLETHLSSGSRLHARDSPESSHLSGAANPAAGHFGDRERQRLSHQHGAPRT